MPAEERATHKQRAFLGPDCCARQKHDQCNPPKSEHAGTRQEVQTVGTAWGLWVSLLQILFQLLWPNRSPRTPPTSLPIPRGAETQQKPQEGSAAPIAISTPHVSYPRTTRRGKRKGSAADSKNENDASGDSGDGEGRRRKRRHHDGDKPDQSRPFACPYFKRNPSGHWDCRSPKLSRTSDVTQHIRRKHLQPRHCPRCGYTPVGVNLDQQLTEHCRQLIECPVSEFPRPAGATPDQMEILGRRPLAEHPTDGTRAERRWYGIYQTLFPGAQLPESAYLTDSDARLGNDSLQVLSDLFRDYYTQGRLRRVAESIVTESAPQLENWLREAFDDIWRFAMEHRTDQVIPAEPDGLERPASSVPAEPDPPQSQDAVGIDMTGFSQLQAFLDSDEAGAFMPSASEYHDGLGPLDQQPFNSAS